MQAKPSRSRMAPHTKGDASHSRSLISWNTNSLPSEKLFLHETERFLADFDVMIISGICSTVLPQHFLPDMTQTLSLNLVLVRQVKVFWLLSSAAYLSVLLSLPKFSCDANSSWVEIMSLCMPRPVIVCACYNPPQGSHQLGQ